MNRILIIYPHWPPSNLVGVHRVRLIANELPELGWETTVLTVDERDYEEALSPETTQLISEKINVVKVRAKKPMSFFGKRIVGDIGLRGWHSLKSEARKLLATQPFDFIWFSMPSWYPSLMGTPLTKEFQVPFGIDYQDPWVYVLASHQKGLNRATATIWLARILEPIALRKVRLISGINEGYLSGVLKRNPRLQGLPKATCQLGFSMSDHRIEIPGFKAPFAEGKRTFVYAGAHWAQGHPLFGEFLQSLAMAKNVGNLADDVQFLFIGTGNPELPSLSEMAHHLMLGEAFREIPQRLSYLEVQQILRMADGALVLGSVEPHYSASKIFQCLLTAKRVMAYFHAQSEGAIILKECQADGFYQPYNPEGDSTQRIRSLQETLTDFTSGAAQWQPNLTALNAHSAKSSAQKLVSAIQELQAAS